MKKAAKIILIAAGALIALLLLAFVLVNTPLNKVIVRKIAAEHIDGALDYDRLRLRLRPSLGLELDTLELRSAAEDTLLRFDRLEAYLSGRKLLRKSIEVKHFSLQGLDARLKTYRDGGSDWNIFKVGPEPKDTSDTPPSLPPVSVRDFEISDARALLDLAGTGRFEVPFGVSLEADICPSDEGTDVSVGRFLFTASDNALDVRAFAKDLFGADPLYDLDAGARLNLSSIQKFIPDTYGISGATGVLDVDLKADARKSELNTYKFRQAEIEGQLSGDRISLRLVPDSMEVMARTPLLSVKSGPEGLDVNLGIDSLHFGKGKSMALRIRELESRAAVTKVRENGKMTPSASVSAGAERIFFQTGSDRILSRRLDVNLAATKRVRVIRDTAEFRRPEGQRPDFLQDEELEKGDITFNVDSTINNFLRDWSASGRITIGKAGLISPRMPLRTRIYGTDINFNDNEFRIDSLHAVSGTSDLSVKGSLEGISRAVTRKGPVKADLALKSGRLNVNEILLSLQQGKEDGGIVEVADEGDESFVSDSLSTAGSDTLKTGLIIVPANIIASLSLDADRIEIKGLDVDSLSARIRMQERTVQLTDTRLSSNYGRMNLEAFYSTRTRKDINAGIDLALSDVSAAQIIGLLPTVDDMMPALKSFEGILGCQVSATTQLDTNMNVLMPTLDGLIKVTGENLSVRDAGDLKRITRLLLFRNKNIGQIDNLYASAVIHDNRLEVFPFELGVDRYRLALYGMQGFDNTMYYHVSILKSPFILRFGINIYGTPDNWRFRLCFPKYKPGKVPAFEKELDGVRFNITKSIRNIFRDGIDGIRRNRDKSLAELEKSRLAKDFNPTGDGGELSLEDQTDVLDLVIDNDFTDADKALEEEVDAILAESYKDTEKIMKEYAGQAYERGISNQIEKLKAQSERRKASKKQKEK